ncbi:MAG TPA: hypothetical protein DCF44_02420, partial [Chitinophagaceae bacterium]|nr:hypothetical protein [Chitinophagaceae bacterium]
VFAVGCVLRQNLGLSFSGFSEEKGLNVEHQKESIAYQIVFSTKETGSLPSLRSCHSCCGISLNASD